MTSAEALPKRRVPARGGRRRSRELALQGLYQWLLNDTSAADLLEQLRAGEEHAQADDAYLAILIKGTTAQAVALRGKLVPHLDREVQQLSPVEHAILLLGAYELHACPDVPYKVVINEAVELAKIFGGTDGHKYINGVLDRLAPELRPNEPGLSRS
ncbi:MAG: transcription antitermination factor NusB [Betaproteobacteria bacterium]|nr:transcription antitermination factor NusB [Betaproteobacteria bacterium]